MSHGPIVVYGANGATGRLIVRLATEAGLDVIAAGRSRPALETVARGHEIRVGSLAADDLDRVCAGAGTVISCVAPYTLHGRPLAEAAIRQHAHYVDCTGEPRYVLSLLNDLDAAARAAGVALVPAAGIGLCTNVVARAAVDAHGDPQRLTVDYRVRGMIPSPGTVSSTLRLIAVGAAVARGGQIALVPAGGRPVLLPGGGLGARFPLTDVITLHRQWPDAEIDSYIRSWASPVIAPATRVAITLARRTRSIGAVERLATRLLPNAPPPRGQFDVTVVAAGPSTVVRAVGRVADIYEMTSRAALYVANTLLTGGAAPGFRATGEIIGDLHTACADVGIELSTHA